MPLARAVNADGKDALETPVRRGATLVVRGWAIDRRYVTAASDVYACVDGRTFVRGIIGTLRSDVAGSIGVQTLARWATCPHRHERARARRARTRHSSDRSRRRALRDERIAPFTVVEGP